VSLRAFRIHDENGRIVARYETLELNDLSPGDVVIRVAWSGINYKDALAATGSGKILRKYPLVGGIDLAGVVEQSSDARYQRGDRVLVTGCDLSETRDGGYAELARVPGDSVVPLPGGLDERTAMAIGTAGFTAALAIHRMEANGQTAALGPIVVTGATGGVGSLALDMLSARGYQAIALTGKGQAESYLRSIGASQVLLRQSIDYGSRPLERAQFGGAIDNVGAETLAWLTRTVSYGGNIASVGLAGGPRLETTVMPFILRAVNLLGINSVSTPRALRLEVWKRIASDLAPRHLSQIVTREISFDLLAGSFQDYIKGEVVGRTVVRVS
jgi:acrylyl-CoA reductase (NADPH)